MKVLPVLLFLCSIAFPVYSIEAYITHSLVESNDPFTVGDVIYLYPQSNTIHLGKKIPSPGVKPALLSLSEVKKHLHSTGLISGVLVGKRPIFIPVSIQNIQERSFYIQLLDFLRTEFPDQNERLELDLINNYAADASVTGEKWSFSIEETNPVFIHVSGRKSGGDTVFYRVGYSRTVPVYVSKKYISAGTQIDKSELSIKFISRNNIPESLTFLKNETAPFYAAKNIHSGIPLSNADITANEMVNKGERISIIIERGSLVIKLAGRTLEAAEVGSAVRVKPASGTKEITGILAGNDEVRID